MKMNSTNLLLFSVAGIFLILACQEASCRQIYGQQDTNQEIRERRATNPFSFITDPVYSAVSSVTSGISSAASAARYVAQRVAYSIPLVGRLVPDPRIPDETQTNNPGDVGESTTEGTEKEGNKSEGKSTNLFSFITNPVYSAVSTVASGISGAVSAVVYVAQRFAYSIPLVGRWVSDPSIPDETPTSNPGDDWESITEGTEREGNKKEGQTTNLFSFITNPVYSAVSYVFSGIYSAFSTAGYAAQRVAYSIPLIGRWVPDPRIPNKTPTNSPGDGGESTKGGIEEEGCSPTGEYVKKSEIQSTHLFSFITDPVYSAVSYVGSVVYSAVSSVTSGISSAVSTAVYVAQRFAYSIPLLGRWVTDPRIPDKTPTNSPIRKGCTTTGGAEGDGNTSEKGSKHIFSFITDPVYNAVSSVASRVSRAVSTTVYVAQKFAYSIPLVGRWVPYPRTPNETPANKPGDDAESTSGDSECAELVEDKPTDFYGSLVNSIYDDSSEVVVFEGEYMNVFAGLDDKCCPINPGKCGRPSATTTTNWMAEMFPGVNFACT